jgi:hypothetical protein
MFLKGWNVRFEQKMFLLLFFAGMAAIMIGAIIGPVVHNVAR